MNDSPSSNEKVRFIRTALIEAHATIVRARGSKLLLKDINDALGMLDGDGVSLEPSSGDWYLAEDIDRHVRELDVWLNGEAGAAKQARLCDIVAQVRRLAQPPNDPRPAEYAALIRAFADWWLGHHDDSRFFNEAMQASPVLAVGMGDTLRQALTKTVRIEPNPLRDWEVPDEKSARCMAAVADAKCVREAGHSGDHYWGPASHPDNCQCNTCYTRKTVAAVETDAPLLCGCDDICIGPDNVGVAQCRAENDEL